MIRAMENFSSEVKLKRWSLFTLERRQMQGDIIKIHRLTNGRGLVESCSLSLVL